MENELIFDAVEACVEAFRQGQMVIVADDENRENEGDLIIAAEKVTPEAINFMVVNARGLVCVPMTGARLRELGVERAPSRNRGDKFATAFTYSVDAAAGVTTGISAADRARTVQTLIDPSSVRVDREPRTYLSLEAREGGVLVRAGHTEAAVDLAKLAGLKPAGVICEIMLPDGTMARMPVARIRHAARAQDAVDRRPDPVPPPPRAPDRFCRGGGVADRARAVQAGLYTSSPDGGEHLALIKGDLAKVDAPLVRVHSECLTAMCSARRAATAATSSTQRCRWWSRRGAAWCSTWSGGARHRPGQQAARLQAAREGAGYRGRQPEAGFSGGSA
jgi:3,4-dihydroxy 2-butanone 4-phosphate synthase/GTP cyclohydrolase II